MTRVVIAPSFISLALFSLALSGCGKGAPSFAAQSAPRPAVAGVPSLTAANAGLDVLPPWIGDSGDFADTTCSVVLRQSWVNLESSMGPQTDCSSGTCWVVVNGNFDVAMALVQDDVVPGVLYQSAIDGTWREQDALPSWNAGLGYRRYSFTLNHDTFTDGPNSQTVNLIPFVRTVAGGRAFDHNRIADLMGSYSLTGLNAWNIPADSSCPAAAPHGIQTLVFAVDWSNSGYGSLVQNGKLDINYDIYRIPSGLGCTTDGVSAFAVTAYAQLQPSGTILSERIDGPLDTTAMPEAYQSLPLEFDIPADATGVALWFLDSSECNGDDWDSQYGSNYVYSVSM
jgi:hypothetical protein